MQIIDAFGDYAKHIETFLSSIESIKEIDVDILSLGCCIEDETSKEVVGYVTYEKYCEYGLIRYFIFKKAIPIHYVIEMFEKLKENAKNNQIESLIAIAKSKEVVELFQKLEFYDISNTNLIINGQNLLGTELEDAVILKHDLK